jgi:hypothetical protein
MVFFLLNCLGIGKNRRRSSNGSAPVPRFQITQIPDDGIKKLLKPNQVAVEEKINEPVPASQPNTQAKRISYWKPYHNASVAVSSALTGSSSARLPSMNMILYEEDEYVKLAEENKKSSFIPIAEEEQVGTFKRTPTPDALVTFDEFEGNEVVSAEIEVCPEIIQINDSKEEEFESQTESEPMAFDIGESVSEISPEALLVESMIPGPELIPLPSLEEEEITLCEMEKEITIEKEEPEKEFEKVEISMENLFSELSEAASYIHLAPSTPLSETPLEMRMSLRCKTRVNEMATWFEKQMAYPEHNETFEN